MNESTEAKDTRKEFVIGVIFGGRFGRLVGEIGQAQRWRLDF